MLLDDMGAIGPPGACSYFLGVSPPGEVLGAVDTHTVSFRALHSTCLCIHLPFRSRLSNDLEAPKEQKWLWAMP